MAVTLFPKKHIKIRKNMSAKAWLEHAEAIAHLQQHNVYGIHTPPSCSLLYVWLLMCNIHCMVLLYYFESEKKDKRKEYRGAHTRRIQRWYNMMVVHCCSTHCTYGHLALLRFITQEIFLRFSANGGCTNYVYVNKDWNNTTTRYLYWWKIDLVYL